MNSTSHVFIYIFLHLIGALIFHVNAVATSGMVADPNPASSPSPFLKKLPAFSKNKMDFTSWDNVLKANVVSGKKHSISLNLFNYAGLVDNIYWKNFTDELQSVDLAGVTENQWKAFWINLYNYLAIRLVFSHSCAKDMVGSCRPLASIREIGEQQPSMFKHIVLEMTDLLIEGVNEGKPISLNYIENIIRNPPSPWREDPRIHACLVCACISCPDLRLAAYTWQNLDEEMTNSTKEFLSNPKKGASLLSDGSLSISSTFLLNAEDFTNHTGSLKFNRTNSESLSWFLSTYGPSVVQEALKRGPNIHYLPFDWGLNGDVDGLCTVRRSCFPWWAFLCILVGISTVVSAIIVFVKKNTEQPFSQGSVLEDFTFEE